MPKVNVVFKYLGILKLAFLWKSVKSFRHRRENRVDTLKLHHDTLLKTLKKHWRNTFKYRPGFCDFNLSISLGFRQWREQVPGLSIAIGVFQTSIAMTFSSVFLWMVLFSLLLSALLLLQEPRPDVMSRTEYTFLIVLYWMDTLHCFKLRLKECSIFLLSHFFFQAVNFHKTSMLFATDSFTGYK